MTAMRGGRDLTVVLVLLARVLMSRIGTLTWICCSKFSSCFGRSNEFPNILWVDALKIYFSFGEENTHTEK